MEDMLTWFRAQLDDDERVARATIHPGRSGRWQFDQYEEDGASRWEMTFDDIAPALYDTSGMGPSTMRHMARWDPASVLADIAAKRSVLDILAARLAEHAKWFDPTDSPISALHLDDLWTAVQQLATAYDKRPGYRDEWRP